MDKPPVQWNPATKAHATTCMWHLSNSGASGVYPGSVTMCCDATFLDLFPCCVLVREASTVSDSPQILSPQIHQWWQTKVADNRYQVKLISILQILVVLGNLFVAGNGQFCLTVYITPSELHLFLWNIKVLIKQGDNLHVFT